jgi:hypothetical protein
VQETTPLHTPTFTKELTSLQRRSSLLDGFKPARLSAASISPLHLQGRIDNQPPKCQSALL